MYKNKRVVALIPAREGSKRIPGKNIKLLLGKPLISYTIQQAKNSKYIDDFFVSTDGKEIASVSEEFGAKVIKRPQEYANDTATMTSVIKHFLKSIKSHFDVVVLLQPTSPLRTPQTIDLAIKKFIDNYEKYDSLMPLHIFRKKIGTIQEEKYFPENKLDMRSQDLEERYFECGTVFIYKVENISSLENIYGKKIFPFIVKSDKEIVDVDDLKDFEYAEFLLSKN